MSLIDKLLKNSTLDSVDVLTKSKLYNDRDMIQTSVPMINVALSGSLDGGMLPGLHVVSGPSRHFKTGFALLLAKAYMHKHKDSVMIFYDSEFGTPQSYFDTFGIDTNRVLHSPITTLEDLKFDVMRHLTTMDKDNKIVIVIDSIGNLASKKELEDAIDGKSVADMSRAKSTKSLFRMVTPHLTIKDIPMIAVGHVYQTQEMFSKTIISGGCLSKDDKIIMSDGTLKSISDVEVGDYVKTLNDDEKVTHIWNPDTLDEGEPECFEVEFDDGHKVICSENHMFKRDGIWERVSDLSKFDIIESNGIDIFVESIKLIGKRKVYDISVENEQHYLLSNGVASHNTGILYSSDTAWIIGRQQDKQGKELQGYNFVINVEKSRHVKEKSKIVINVDFENGINTYSGLMEVAVELGAVIKPSNGWYSKVDLDTGEAEEKKYRMNDTHNSDFWDSILSNDIFKQRIESQFKIGFGKILKEED